MEDPPPGICANECKLRNGMIQYSFWREGHSDEYQSEYGYRRAAALHMTIAYRALIKLHWLSWYLLNRRLFEK